MPCRCWSRGSAGVASVWHTPRVESEPASSPRGAAPAAVRLTEYLGVGATGVWWRASVGGGRSVAVKLLQEDLPAPPEVVERLRELAARHVRLRHPAVAALEDLLEIDGRPALVYELVEGVDLAPALKRGPLPAGAALRLAAALADALAAAHAGVPDRSGRRVQLVCRDLSPWSVRLTRAGDVKLLDFGALLSELAPGQSRGGIPVVGRPGYLAPEAAWGEAGAAADVFALGVVTWECLTGEVMGEAPADRAAFEAWRAERLARLPEAAFAELVGPALAWFAGERPAAGVFARAFLAEADGRAGSLRLVALERLAQVESAADETVAMPMPVALAASSSLRDSGLLPPLPAAGGLRLPPLPTAVPSVDLEPELEPEVPLEPEPPRPRPLLRLAPPLPQPPTPPAAPAVRGDVPTAPRPPPRFAPPDPPSRPLWTPLRDPPSAGRVATTPGRDPASAPRDPAALPRDPASLPRDPLTAGREPASRPRPLGEVLPGAAPLPLVMPQVAVRNAPPPRAPTVTFVSTPAALPPPPPLPRNLKQAHAGPSPLLIGVGLLMLFGGFGVGALLVGWLLWRADGAEGPAVDGAAPAAPPAAAPAPVPTSGRS